MRSGSVGDGLQLGHVDRYLFETGHVWPRHMIQLLGSALCMVMLLG
jgi:hypothetical protein